MWICCDCELRRGNDHRIGTVAHRQNPRQDLGMKAQSRASSAHATTTRPCSATLGPFRSNHRRSARSPAVSFFDKAWGVAFGSDGTALQRTDLRPTETSRILSPANLEL